MPYGTTTNGNRASSAYTTQALAEQLANKQNAKAEELGIESRYEVVEVRAGPNDKARDTLPSMWL